MNYVLSCLITELYKFLVSAQLLCLYCVLVKMDSTAETCGNGY